MEIKNRARQDWRARGEIFFRTTARWYLEID